VGGAEPPGRFGVKVLICFSKAGRGARFGFGAAARPCARVRRAALARVQRGPAPGPTGYVRRAATAYASKYFCSDLAVDPY
jgi:hypothetical protein